MTTTIPPIDTFPPEDMPLISDPIGFPQKAEDWVKYQNEMVLEQNAANTAINTAGAEMEQLNIDADASANLAALSAEAAAASSGFAGVWSSLTGPLEKHVTVAHNDSDWRLLVDLADVTASEPSQTNADWLINSSRNAINENHLQNAHCYQPSPDSGVVPVPVPPGEDYTAGEQVFQGWFVSAGGITGLSRDPTTGLIDRLSGSIYQKVPKSGPLGEYTGSLVASWGNNGGQPTEDGAVIDFTDEGDYYRVTLSPNGCFSAKFEQGVVASKHEALNLFDTYGHPNMGIYNIKAYGAIGGGLTLADDAINLANAACEAAGGILTIPDDDFLIAEEHEFKVRVECYGELLIDNSVPNDFIAVKLGRDNRSYPWQSVVTGLRVKATGKQTTNIIGILNVSTGSTMRDCRSVGCGMNIVVGTFTVTLNNCVGYDGGKNLVIARGDNYTTTGLNECNDIKIIGGNYNTALYYTMSIGDDYIYPDDMTGSPQGQQILIQGAAFDGNQVWVRSVFDVKFDTCYWENTVTQNRLMTIGDPAHTTVTRLVTVDNCFFATAPYGVYIEDNTDLIEIRPCHFRGINKCRIYKDADSQGRLTVHKQSGVGNTGPLVHTGVDFNSTDDTDFTNYTILDQNLNSGVQLLDNSSGIDEYYPTCKVLVPAGEHITTHNGGRVYDNPETALGSWSGFEFTFTTFNDVYKFNGGDRINGGFIRKMDYDNGKAITSVAGSGDLVQQPVIFHKRLSGLALPTSGDYRAGDIVFNNYTVVSNVFAWSCSVSGNPGTWRATSST